MERDKRTTEELPNAPAPKRFAGMMAIATSPTVELSPRAPTAELVAPTAGRTPRRVTRNTGVVVAKVARPTEYRIARRKTQAACRIAAVEDGQVELVTKGKTVVLTVAEARALAELIARTLG